MFKRSALSSAIVLAGSVWGSVALANTDSAAKFSSATEINKVSEWMGKEVQDNEGNEIGEISDFALNLKDGSIAYAVVEMGGMFSNKAIAVPVTALSTSAESDDELTLQVSQSEWESAETFSGSDWPLEASLAADTGDAVTSMPDKASTNETADSGWQQSDDQSEDRYDQGSGAVSSFDRDVEFDTLDTDGDGYLSTEEYQAAKGSTAAGETDQNQDGRISRSEFAAFEAREQEDGTQKKSSTEEDRYGKSDADHSYDDSHDVEDDAETDD